VHALVIWALVTGLGRTIVEVIKKPLTATIVEQIKPPPPPPPPPKKIIEPPKTQPLQTYVPPPDVPPPVQQAAPVISAVTATPPPEPVAIAPPAATPPPPPKPAVRRGIQKIAGDDPSYPREAIKKGIGKGHVVARLQIDEKGNVLEVNIVTSEPNGVFDRVVRDALKDWKFRGEGEKYVGEVEINFTLKDD